MFPIRIIANEILNLTDARYFAARGADYLCLNTRENTNALKVEEIMAIKNWVEGPGILLYTDSKTETRHFQEAVQPDGFIACGAEDIGQFNLPNETVKFNIFDVHDFHLLAEHPVSGTDIVLGYDYLILNLRPTGKSVDTLIQQGALPIIQAICAATGVFIDADVSIDGLKDVIEIIRPEGWVVYGGIEEKTGIKSYENLDPFFDALENMSL